MTVTTGADAALAIAGESVAGLDRPYPVHNPARPTELVGHAPSAAPDQLDRAVTSARAAVAAWAALEVAERMERLVAAAQAASAALAGRDLPTLYTREHGKVRTEAELELSLPPVLAQLFAGMAPAALATELVGAPDAYPRLHRDPFGVAALILPFNWPVATSMSKLAPALAAGNAAVVKVPPTCPLAALTVLAELAAALPPGLVNVLCGPGPELGRALVAHPGVDLVSFTGGVATGRSVMAAAADNLTPVLLELGGNDAAIIAPDLPVSDALADKLAAAAYTTTGQVCMAAKRIYAPRARVGEVVEALRARCEREVVGDGLAPGVTLGPLHTAAAFARVRRLVDDARGRGATVLETGALREEDVGSGGYFVRPTIVTGLGPDAPLVAEEQFGPVLPVLAYDDVDDAVRAANATEFGLTASVWTADDALAQAVSGALRAGTVSINCHGMAAQDPRVPFGGFGASGFGREFGVDGIRAYSQSRSVVRHDPPA